jgi:hypothetical protein
VAKELDTSHRFSDGTISRLAEAQYTRQKGKDLEGICRPLTRLRYTTQMGLGLTSKEFRRNDT